MMYLRAFPRHARRSKNRNYAHNPSYDQTVLNVAVRVLHSLPFPSSFSSSHSRLDDQSFQVGAGMRGLLYCEYNRCNKQQVVTLESLMLTYERLPMTTTTPPTPTPKTNGTYECDNRQSVSLNSQLLLPGR